MEFVLLPGSMTQTWPNPGRDLKESFILFTFILLKPRVWDLRIESWLSLVKQIIAALLQEQLLAHHFIMAYLAVATGSSNEVTRSFRSKLTYGSLYMWMLFCCPSKYRLHLCVTAHSVFLPGLVPMQCGAPVFCSSGMCVFCIYCIPALSIVLVLLLLPFTFVSHTHMCCTVLTALFNSLTEFPFLVSSLSSTNWELICSIVFFCLQPFLSLFYCAATFSSVSFFPFLLVSLIWNKFHYP